jgi:hypothetical protein
MRKLVASTDSYTVVMSTCLRLMTARTECDSQALRNWIASAGCETKQRLLLLSVAAVKTGSWCDELLIQIRFNLVR